MIDNKEQIKNSLIYLIPSFVSGIFPIVTLPIFTRILTKEDYGAFALANAYAVFLAGLANFGLIFGYERNFFENKDRKATAGLLYSTLFFVMSTSIFFGVLTYFLKGGISKFLTGSDQYGSLMLLAFCSYAVINIKNYYLVYFKNNENAKAFTWYSIDEIFLGVFFSLFFVAALRIGVLGLVLGQMIASSIILFVLYFRLSRILPFSFNGSLLRESLKISLPLTPRFFISIVGNQFDKYFLGLLSSLGGVGIYSLGQKIGQVAFIYMTAIQNVFNPQMYKRMFSKEDEIRDSIGKYLTPFAYVSVLVALLIALFSEEVVSLLMPQAYHGAIPIVSIMAMYYGFMFFGKVNGTQLIFMKKTYVTSILTIISLVFNVSFVVLLIKPFGAIGAAWGMFLASLLTGSISFVAAQRCYPIRWEAEKMIIIFSSFFFFSILIIFFQVLGVGYVLRLLFKIVFVIGFFLLGIRINVVSRSNIDLVKAVFFRTDPDSVQAQE